MYKLSKNLTLEEVTYSDTAKRLGIDNSPSSEHLSNLVYLANNIFQPIRDHFNIPIYISSGYRSVALNKKVPGSSSTSQHAKGEAIDIDMSTTAGVTNTEIFEFIKHNLDFDQLIWEYGNDKEPDWVHVSYTHRRPNRKEVLRATRVNGKPHYSKLNP